MFAGAEAGEEEQGGQFSALATPSPSLTTMFLLLLLPFLIFLPLSVAFGAGDHGKEEVGQYGLVVDAAGARKRRQFGGEPRGVDGGPVAAVPREQVRFGVEQSDLPRDLQAAGGGREDGEDSRPGGRREAEGSRGAIQLRSRLPLPALPS